ncbi:MULTISPECIES: helix-turn-helix transcriptional regulator [Paraburkholderia]|uniref:Helix-turn-helix transcriptional regulator n=1 Tax=Paraburkholderia podalyriae TaxID=1938811 RepID=A0ABR7PQG5_9BURK|nr:helix-turn-helix transcriptional regulator [Paraburkholderia podalyriae]MBC8748522.1 helix-turn-helix transcriptional regulator [Paraburkholderia podalyriae]
MNQVEQQVTQRGRPRKPRVLVSEAAREEARVVREEARIAHEDAQREAELKEPLKRFVRNRASPAELEALRYRLIQARVENGFSVEDAAARFRDAGVAEPVALSEIESGRAETPTGWRFLRHASEIYAVSSDWLIGLSSDMTLDAKTTMTFALLRGTEGVVAGLLSQFVAAMEQTAQAVQIEPDEVSATLAAVENVVARFKKFSAQDAFEDMPGGAPVVASIQRLAETVAPLRRVHAKFAETEKLFDALRAGTLKPFAWLADDHTETE